MGRTLWVLPVLLLATGCDETLEDLTGPTPNLQPTLSSIQREIFTPTCASCHTNNGRTPAGGLLLLEGASYGQLVGVASTGKPGAVRVIAGDAESSYLIHKLEGRSDIVGLRMPRGNLNPLTEGQILVIRRWIQRGAPND